MSGDLLHARYFHVVYTQRNVLLQDTLQKTQTGSALRARRWEGSTWKGGTTLWNHGLTYAVRVSSI